MSWAPADLVSDRDLLAYETRILSLFGQWDWRDRRAKVLEDWLWPQVRTAGFDPQRFRTRYAPAAAYYGAGLTAVTSAAQDATAEDLDLAAIFAASDQYLYLGSTAPFRGLSVRVTDTPSATAATLTVQAWRDAWQTLSVDDGTQATSGTPFSRGGAITWSLSDDWVTRSLGDTTGAYWVRLALSAVPTGAKAGQIACIRRSLLAGPLTYRVLALIFREAPLSQDGPWREKADWYETEAERALARALPLLGGEFDTDPQDDVIDATEAAQTASEARGTSGWTWERA